ncbi:unnamed protein product [Choristocarpus tenellus]
MEPAQDELSFPVCAGSTAAEDAPKLSVPTFDVKGKSFIVTGGTQGMGLVIAACLARGGARALTIASRTEALGMKARDRLTSGWAGCEVHYVRGDVSTEDDCKTIACEGDRLMDGIDGLVCEIGGERGGDADLCEKVHFEV